MERIIKFRGKDAETGEWRYGYYLVENQLGVLNHGILQYERLKGAVIGYTVIPETVGQFTGLMDKNGREIYEGDILAFVGSENPKAFFVTVEWDERLCCVYLKRIDCPEPNRYGFFPNCYTLEGNIHDNPELLKTE